MNKYIKADLYYFFHNKMVAGVFIILSLISSVLPWIHNSFGDYKTLSASEYVASLNLSQHSFYDIKTTGMLFISAIISTVLVKGFFKNRIYIQQEIKNGEIIIPIVAMMVADLLIIVMYMLPFFLIMTALSVINGTYSMADAGNSYIFLLMLLGMITINMMHIAMNVLWISFVTRNEIVGIIVTIVLELLKTNLISMLFLGGGGNVMWVPYGLFPALNCQEMTFRAMNIHTNVPVLFDFILPFIGFIFDFLILGVILIFAEKRRRKEG